MDTDNWIMTRCIYGVCGIENKECEDKKGFDKKLDLCDGKNYRLGYVIGEVHTYEDGKKFFQLLLEDTREKLETILDKVQMHFPYEDEANEDPDVCPYCGDYNPKFR